MGSMEMWQQDGELLNGELVIGLACATGTNSISVCRLIEQELEKYKYQCNIIKISKQLLEPTTGGEVNALTSYERSKLLMDKGNELRKMTNKNYILSCGAANIIHAQRDNNASLESMAFIIDSLKHPAEVEKLREVYPSGFYLFAIHESEQDRVNYLTINKGMSQEEAQKLVQRDISEELKYGQHTREVFELADFHLSSTFPWTENACTEVQKRDNLAKQLKRILELIFGNPFVTPTFDEYAMFMAYSSGLRSADLSRQVGAVVAKDNEIIATGANEVPAYGGGQYWLSDEYKDVERGRDYKRGWDSNKRELSAIVDELVDRLDFSEKDETQREMIRKEAKENFLNSTLKNLTEYGRPVHAEMAAIMSCARSGIALKGATLYCSTFPCHNCAKHIISAGIKKVIYVEPYPKSKTLELYDDSTSDTGVNDKVWFCEFVGIGPRRFYDLFSMNLSSGVRMKRKQKDGNIVDWQPENARLRCQMVPLSYIEKEALEAMKWNRGRNQSE